MMKSPPGPVMPPTDERMVPESAGAPTFWEHVYRYRFAKEYVSGKRVLDVACGEGYGTKALSTAGAANVVGVDISPETCAHARTKYRVDARVGDAMHLPLEHSSVDVVVSFETIEHVRDPGAFLDECARVLIPDGILIISTPNSPVYDPVGGTNPYHVSEMNEQSFVELLRQRFSEIRMYSQAVEVAEISSARYICARSNGPRRLWRKFVKLVTLRRFRTNANRRPRPTGKDPVSAILSRSSIMDRIFNPLVVRERDQRSGEKPMMFVAVCRQKLARP